MSVKERREAKAGFAMRKLVLPNMRENRRGI